MIIADQIRMKALQTPAYRRVMTSKEIGDIFSISFYGLGATDNQIKVIRTIFTAVRKRLRAQGGIK